VLEIEGLGRDGIFGPCSLKADAGQCVMLKGASGSGKTLFLRAISDLDPNQGRVLLGADDRDQMPAPTWRQKVVYHPAEPGWWDDYVPPHFKRPEQLARDVTLVGLPTAILEQPLSRLSTGERQRLALLRSFEGSPQVLLLDEPTSGLDPQSVTQVEGILRQKIAQGCILIMSSHDTEQIARMADSVMVMEQGQLTEIERGQSG